MNGVIDKDGVVRLKLIQTSNEIEERFQANSKCLSAGRGVSKEERPKFIGTIIANLVDKSARDHQEPVTCFVRPIVLQKRAESRHLLSRKRVVDVIESIHWHS